MKLHEYQAKQLLARQGVPVPRGMAVCSPEEAMLAAEQLGGGPVVVKAQVLVGGRGKAGGVKLAQNPTEAKERAAEILALTIKGLPVHQVLIEEAAVIGREIYLGLAVDRAARRVTLIASGEGGIEIEEVAARNPEAILKIPLDPFLGFQPYQAVQLAREMRLIPAQYRRFGEIVDGLYRTFMEVDASLAEINPLIVTGEGDLLALDGKIVIDDNALFRHAALDAFETADDEPEPEREAHAQGLSYVALGGSVGCMVNGAGLAMATLDIIQHFGGTPANFLDIGGGARSEKVAAALRIILSEPQVRVVLINIFGGITRCDEVARGLLAALDEVRPQTPLVVRLVGTNEAEGQSILQKSGYALEAVASLSAAAQRAVALASRV